MNNQYSHMTKEQVQDDVDLNQQISKMHEQGISMARIGRYVGLNASTVCRRLATINRNTAYNPDNSQDFKNSHRPHVSV